MFVFRKRSFHFSPLTFLKIKRKMQAEPKETRFIPNPFADYDDKTANFPALYKKLASVFTISHKIFEKKVKPTEPISICSVKSKSTYSYSIFEGKSSNSLKNSCKSL